MKYRDTVPGTSDGHRYIVLDEHQQPLRVGDRLTDQQGYEGTLISVENGPWKKDAKTALSTTLGVRSSSEFNVEVKLNPTAQRLTDAGVKYPATSYWTEYGSSEKDVWEDRRLRYLDRMEKRGALNIGPATPPASIPTIPEPPAAPTMSP